MSADTSSERPLRADARRNRARVLEAARTLFAERGVAAGIDDIARAAGVGVGTLYRHFPDKESLAVAVVADDMDGLLETAHALALRDDAASALRDLLRAMAGRSRCDIALAETFAAAGFDVKAGLASRKQELLGIVDDLVARAQAAGTLRAGLRGADVLGLLMGTCMAAGRVAPGDEACVARMLDVVLDGLVAPA